LDSKAHLEFSYGKDFDFENKVSIAHAMWSKNYFDLSDLNALTPQCGNAVCDGDETVISCPGDCDPVKCGSTEDKKLMS